MGIGEKVSGVAGKFTGKEVEVFGVVADVGGVAGFGVAFGVNGCEDQATEAVEEGLVEGRR